MSAAGRMMDPSLEALSNDALDDTAELTVSEAENGPQVLLELRNAVSVINGERLCPAPPGNRSGH